MGKYQIFSVHDPLREFKECSNELYDCSFFEHEDGINRTMSIGCGERDNKIVRESIITDGDIYITGRNTNKSLVMFQNHLIQLDNDLSMLIKLANANYFINVINYGDLKEYDIHVVKEELETLRAIVEYISGKKNLETIRNSIVMEYPQFITLNNYSDGKIQTETINCFSEFGKTLIKK